MAFNCTSLLQVNSVTLIPQQECIPVGCVPAARRPYSGVCFRGGALPVPGGSTWSRGGSPCLGGCGPPCPGGSPWSGGLSLPGGFSLPGGVLPARGVCLVGGEGVLPAGGVLPAWRPHPPVNRITHTCKNITLATTSLRPVITLIETDSYKGKATGRGVKNRFLTETDTGQCE